MRILLIALVCVACSAHMAERPPEKNLIAGEFLLQEIASLKQQLEAYHPGLYWYQSKADFETGYERLVSRAEEGLVRDEYIRELTTWIATIGCGHTRLRLPGDFRDDLMSASRMIPFNVYIENDRAFIRRPLVSGLELNEGDEITSINDVSANELVKDMMSRISHDGNGQSAPTYYLERNWPYYLALSKFADSAYQVTLRRDGEEMDVKLSGVTYDDLLKRKNESVLKLTFSVDSLLAIMRIGSFGGSEVGSQYESFLDRSFQQINESEASRLILDLRGNGGGRDMFGALLVSYFAKKEFGYFEKIVVTEEYDGWGRLTKSGNERLMHSHEGLSIQAQSPNRFNGEVMVLIDGGSFSTCADVASVMKVNGLGLFVGQETGGGAGGNTSGASTTFSGPYSGIEVNIPNWKYYTAGSVESDFGRGVRPDVEVSRSEMDAPAADFAKYFDYSK